jgi:PhnB protein
MYIEPYLYFEGRCEEAINFYREALGAEVQALMRFKESPDPQMCPPGGDEKVMHALLRIGESNVMVSDGMCSGQSSFQGISLSLMANDVAEADRLFAALGEGGQVQMPMGETFFAKRFGMVADRFGVSWMVLAEPAEAPEEKNG